MTPWIALLRGINVGGNNKLAMQDLTRLLEEQGGSRVQTYIQSGNALFRHPTGDRHILADLITHAIEQSHGFAPRVLLLTPAEWEQALAANPFPEGEREPKSLHLFFLEAPPPSPDLAALEALRSDSERFALIESCFYLHTPEGIGRSKLAARIEKALGVAATARNWNTCLMMRDLVRTLA